MLNNHVNCDFIYKKTNICIIYRYVFINEINIFNFWSNVSKKFNKCLISNQIPKYLSTHMEIFLDKIIKWKLAN